MNELFIVFITNHADTIGNNVRLSLIEGLNKEYNTICFTNQFNFIDSRNICNKTILLPQYNGILKKVPILSSLLDARTKANFINKFMNKSRLFIFHDTSDIALFIDKQNTIFNCVHQIHEFEGFYKRKGLGAISQGIKKYFLLKGLKKSHSCFVISATIEKYLMDNGINNKLFITPHFVNLDNYIDPRVECDLSYEMSIQKNKGKFIIIYTGWVSENRGLEMMLQIAKNLSSYDKKYLIYIVGCSDVYFELISNFAVDNMIVENLIPIKRIDAVYIPSVLKISDVCLSFLERNQVFEVSPPQKVIEYFAAGKPVITNRIKTHEELIRNGENGFLCDTYEEAVEVIKLLSENIEVRNKVEYEALKTAEKYSKEIIMKSICEIINT